jgi:hypothetical protein
MKQPNNLIFWGPGATAKLGIPTTQEQADFVRKLAGVDQPNKSLRDRIAEALRQPETAEWRTALYELILILGDSNDARARIDAISDEELDAMRPNWRISPSDDELQRRIIGLRLIYDWPTLKSVIRICPASHSQKFQLNDLLNVLDIHINSGVRIPVNAVRDQSRVESEELFFEGRRLIGARNALQLILTALFHIAYQICLSNKRERLEQYYDFAAELGRRSHKRDNSEACARLVLQISRAWSATADSAEFSCAAVSYSASTRGWATSRRPTS